MTMNDPITSIIYNDASATILTAGGKDVKIWGTDGSLLNSYSNFSDHKITAVCLDDRKRKFLLGDTRGSIKVYICGSNTK